ncbi:mCG145052, partial [Mus musculus]
LEMGMCGHPEHHCTSGDGWYCRQATWVLAEEGQASSAQRTLALVRKLPFYHTEQQGPSDTLPWAFTGLNSSASTAFLTLPSQWRQDQARRQNT